MSPTLSLLDYNPAARKDGSGPATRSRGPRSRSSSGALPSVTLGVCWGGCREDQDARVAAGRRAGRAGRAFVFPVCVSYAPSLCLGRCLTPSRVGVQVWRLDDR